MVSNAAWLRLERLTHTSRVGGVSVTEQTALTVRPAGPAGPSVVTTLTPADRFAIADRKSCWVVVVSSIIIALTLILLAQRRV